ncbi:UbiH/UbiF/VisC/COQ6 family ubiquinone biosynthesis hydroxylase [Rhodospirillaceae bacterium SYSU D60014]|uniref:UbiH/UbiF/VisC/COQ6 family ubiquinone biosynthesis hydroxylase n=1 Tax=Virgifigura deserti TaxID=2268457 RepID=UPI000E66804F
MVTNPEQHDLIQTVTADVAIIGGGMVGMTLAVALADAGIAVALVDAQAAPERTATSYDGRSSAIAFGSQQVLAGIGVWPGMAAEAQPILDIRVSDGDARGRTSRLFLHYDHRDLAGGDADAPPFGHIIENQVIRRALLDRLAALPTARHLAPARIAGLARTAGGVRVALSPNPTGVTEIAATLAIGADGQGSPVRALAGIRVTDWSYPQTGIVCTVAHEKPHHGVAHEHFLPSGPFAMLPMVPDQEGRNRSSIVWTERRAPARTMMALDADAFAAEIEHRFGDSLGRLRPVGGRWAYPLRLLHAERYADDRLALVGDAAHAIHPIAGQGLNLGLRDVAALAEALVDARRLGLDIGAADVLERYERWRRFDTLVLMAVTDGLNRLFSNDLLPLRLARDLGLAAVNRLPSLKRVLMRHAMGTAGELPRLVRGEPL